MSQSKLTGVQCEAREAREAHVVEQLEVALGYLTGGDGDIFARLYHSSHLFVLVEPVDFLDAYRAAAWAELRPVFVSLQQQTQAFADEAAADAFASRVEVFCMAFLRGEPAPARGPRVVH